jgi:hypothetical protein
MDRAIGPPSALLTLLISHFQKLNHSHFIGLSTVVQQLLEQVQPANGVKEPLCEMAPALPMTCSPKSAQN